MIEVVLFKWQGNTVEQLAHKFGHDFLGIRVWQTKLDAETLEVSLLHEE